MTKARKKNSKKTSPVFLSDNQAAHEAPDNPLDPPPVVGLGDMSYSSVARRRSERLRPVLPETLDNDDMSNRVSPGFDLEEPEVGRISDRNERSVTVVPNARAPTRLPFQELRKVDRARSVHLDDHANLDPQQTMGIKVEVSKEA